VAAPGRQEWLRLILAKEFFHKIGATKMLNTMARVITAHGHRRRPLLLAPPTFQMMIQATRQDVEWKRLAPWDITQTKEMVTVRRYQMDTDVQKRASQMNIVLTRTRRWIWAMAYPYHVANPMRMAYGIGYT
jgi:hypothetical protein